MGRRHRVAVLESHRGELDKITGQVTVAEQEKAFRRQIDVARDVGLPIIVHSREAEEETLAILQAGKAGDVGGVIHCFSGGVEMAREALSMGFFISFSGSLTFKNAAALRTVAETIPIEKVLVETDCPYLAPQPVRGKRNEPAHVRFVAETLAEIHGLRPADVGRITSHNAMQLFRFGEVDPRGKIAYQIRDSLYLNITNRCTNTCGFCVRNDRDFVKGHNLRLYDEPTTEEVIAAIANPRDYREVVFCGYGEPLIRLDVVQDVAAWIKGQGGMVRVNTNGQGNLIHQRNIVSELRGLVDAYSVSLNAENEEKYNALCRPAFGAGTYEAVKSFIQEAAKVADVSVTVLNLAEVDVEACRRIARDELHVGFRLRYHDDVG
ncbi:MAG: TatD family nuclease-associated radical SAM protein [bacterium]|nr:TatD family nuclease-associated radical SAM protein [bacterium]